MMNNTQFKPSSISNCLEEGISLLERAGVPEPRVSAEALLCATLGRPRIFLHAEPNSEITELQREHFQVFLKKRAARYPLQYVLGTVQFRDTELAIGEGCLIPRPETEILVDAVLRESDRQSQIVLDIGTGSGNIAISLVEERPSWNVIATDTSADALKFARLNAAKRQVEDRVRFIQTDLWADLGNQAVDTIVSNPPYLTTEELKTLQPEVAFEPRLALYGAEDGLYFYRKIISRVHEILKPGGLVFFEVGLGQAKFVSQILERKGYQNISITRDHVGIERIVGARLLAPLP
jgi:release factor glutamine methyltransferase